MTPEEEEYEYRVAMAKEAEARYYEYLEQMEFDRLYANACERCGEQREDWHNKLCGDGYCAQCSLHMDQLKEV